MDRQTNKHTNKQTEVINRLGKKKTKNNCQVTNGCKHNLCPSLVAEVISMAKFFNRMGSDRTRGHKRRVETTLSRGLSLRS